MKKTLAVILAWAMLLSVTACGNQTGDKPESSPAPDNSQQAGNSEQTPASEDKSITLQYSMPLPVTHQFVGYDEIWIDRVSELTGGSLTINPHWAGALVPMTSSYAETIAGVTDIVHAVPGNELQQFVVDNAMQYMYYPISDTAVLLDVIDELYESTPEWQAEYEGTKVLTYGTSGLMYILSKKPVRSLSDIKGMTIRAQCDIGYKLVEANGGSAVKMPLGELYDSLSKGVVDAVMIPIDTLETMQLDGIVKYATVVNVAEPWYVHKFISEKSWDKLSAAQQEALVQASEERMQTELEGVERLTNSALEYAEEKGVEIIELSDADYETLYAQCETIAKTEVEKLNAAGIDGDAIFEHAREVVEKYAN